MHARKPPSKPAASGSGGDDKEDGGRSKALPSRVADYFVVVGVNDEPTAADNKRRFGGGNNKLPIKVLDRYPKEDHRDAEFPKDLPLV